MIKIDAECREALHTTLDAVIDKIVEGNIFAQFDLNNICLDVIAREKITGNDDFDMYENFYFTFSELDAKAVIDKLDNLEFSTTKQTDTTEDQ